MEKTKTPMQELMEWMNEQSQVIPVDVGECYNKANELLEMEKNHIQMAYNDGYLNASLKGFKKPEQYYNETYDNNTKL